MTLAAASVEAALNELGVYANKQRLRPDRSRFPWAPPLDVLAICLDMAERAQRGPLEKYGTLFEALSGKPLDKGRQPFQDLKLLFDVRNAIMHARPIDEFYTGEPTADDDVARAAEFAKHGIPAVFVYSEPPKYIQTLQARGIARPLTKAAHSWTFIVATPEMALWACKTAADAVQAACQQMPPADPDVPEMAGIYALHLANIIERDFCDAWEYLESATTPG